MQVIVYTYDKSDRNVPGFAYLFNKYWSPWVDVTLLGFRYPPYPLPANFKFHSLNEVSDKPWTFYLRPWLLHHADDYFVFVGDDHWLGDYVDLGAVTMLEGAIRNGAAKANLSGDGLHYFNHRPGNLTGELLIKPPANPSRPPLNWKASLQPAIWRRDYLVSLMEPKGMSPWQFEEAGRTWANSNKDRVISCKHTIWPMTGVEGVQHGGDAYAPNIVKYHPDDLAALKQLGYPNIFKGDLLWELV